MKRQYWAFHLILLLAFLLAILGLTVEGPNGYWNYTVKSKFGTFGVLVDTLGTTFICGADEFTIRFGLYSLIAFALAVTLFGIAAAIGVRFLFSNDKPLQSGKAAETASPSRQHTDDKFP